MRSSITAVLVAAKKRSLSKRLWGRLCDLFEVTKPKVVLLLMFTTGVGAILAPQDGPDWHTLFFAIIGVGLSAASGAAINHLVDERIDAKMHRTGQRPLPSGRLSPWHVFVVAMLFGSTGVGLLAWQVNGLTAALTLLALVGYAVVYSVFLKHSTPYNIVWGGAAGAAPPLLGWVAITDSISLSAVSLFLIIFVWTPPHFWPLAIYRVDDYRKAGVPMLPVARGIPYTKYLILIYAWLLLLVSLLPYLVGLAGVFYLLASMILGGFFVGMAWRFYRDDTQKLAMPLFGYSITYLFLLFSALILDHLLLSERIPWH